MKVLKVILFVVLAIVLIGAVAAFVIPTQYHVERSVTINAPKKLVLQQASSFEKFSKWNPWGKKDPAMVTSIEGTDGQVGAKYSWKGNEDVGEGSMEIIAVSDSRVDQKLRFITPMESEATTFFTVDAAEGGVKVTWGMDGESPRPMNLLNPFMERMIAPDYDQGLANLKSIAETIASADSFRGYKIESVELPARTYIGKMDTVKFADMETFYATNLGAAMNALKKKNAPIAGAPSGIFFMWDEPNQQAIMAATIPVEGEYELAGFEAWPVAGNVLKIAYFGNYEGSAEAHYAMDDYYTARGLEYGEGDLVIEEYITDPATEPDTSKWLTNIYYVNR